MNASAWIRELKATAVRAALSWRAQQPVEGHEDPDGRPMWAGYPPGTSQQTISESWLALEAMRRQWTPMRVHAALEVLLVADRLRDALPSSKAWTIDECALAVTVDQWKRSIE